MAATQFSLVSTYNRPPPNSAAFLGRRGLETQGQTYHGPRLTGGKTHKPGVRLRWQVKARTPPSSQDPFPFCPKVERSTAQSWGCRQTGWPSDQLDHPILCEMLNSPYEWKMALEDGEKMRIQEEV